MRFEEEYDFNVRAFAAHLRVRENFDIVERHLAVSGERGEERLTLFYIDGLTKDGDLQKLSSFILNAKHIGGAEEFLTHLPLAEAEIADDAERCAGAVLAGQTLLLAEQFGARGILLDLRYYPSRSLAEPESDRVMQGARDGFLETLVVNTALIRRRIRDVRLTMECFSLGGSSQTDVVLCYMQGVAEPARVSAVREKIRSLHPRSVTLGFQSLAESLIRRGWWNPFPKIRTTERPDTAAAQVIEGSILVLCDTSPQVMILPTSLFDYLQQTDDYYFPPLTGTYMRLVRTVILLLSVVSTPLWYLAQQYQELIPPMFSFLIPANPGSIPLLAQIYLAELAIDGLKIASMNTPDMLSNSLSVVGALVLSDFAIGVGWFCQDVILYMAFVAIANFAQQNHELGYAFKFMRMLILALTAVLGAPGFLLGLVLFCFFAATNPTVDGRHRYLYPLIPFNGKALMRLLFRMKKQDID